MRLELLNWMTGILLLLSGIVVFFQGKISTAFGWIIFGSMYLVMGDYTPKKNMKGLELLTHRSRTIFSWVGLVFSFALLVTYLL